MVTNDQAVLKPCLVKLVELLYCDIPFNVSLIHAVGNVVLTVSVGNVTNTHNELDVLFVLVCNKPIVDCSHPLSALVSIVVNEVLSVTDYCDRVIVVEVKSRFLPERLEIVSVCGAVGNSRSGYVFGSGEIIIRHKRSGIKINAVLGKGKDLAGSKRSVVNSNVLN